MDLHDRRVLITGAAVRLGRALALALADRGCHVVIHYRRSEEPARVLRQEIEARGRKAWTVAGDLVSQAACEAVVESAAGQAGGLDILINNAGVFHRDPMGSITEENLLAEMWPNCFAPVFLTQAFAAVTAVGRVINFLDRRITTHDERGIPYQLSKKALEEFTSLAARALAPGITVNAIAPGNLLPPPGKDRAYLREHADPALLDADQTPDDIADALLYLLQSDVLTGQVVFVDGGLHLS